MNTCRDCAHTWEAVRPAHCPACGVVVASEQLQLLGPPPEIIAAMRARFTVWSDREAFEDWLLAKAAAVMKGMCCCECGTIHDMDDEPRGRPVACIVCASGYGPAAKVKKPKRERRAKSVVTQNMELIDG